MQPALSAYNEESEPWRLDRLAKAHAYAKGVMSNDPTCPSLDELVHALHDHKGFILVTWRVRPTKALRNAYVRAWESSGEISDYVTHRVNLKLGANIDDFDDWLIEDAKV
jgi:hypothetical protein